MITEFVVVYVKYEDNVLLVLKNRPENLAGKYNLPGGKIEKGESPEECARRELFEETGISCGIPVVYGKIVGKDCVVHCCMIKTDSLHNLSPRDEETEKVNWFKWQEMKENPYLMPNLLLIIPFLHMEVKNWTIIDMDPFSRKVRVNFE